MFVDDSRPLLGAEMLSGLAITFPTHLIVGLTDIIMVGLEAPALFGKTFAICFGIIAVLALQNVLTVEYFKQEMTDGSTRYPMGLMNLQMRVFVLFLLRAIMGAVILGDAVGPLFLGRLSLYVHELMCILGIGGLYFDFSVVLSVLVLAVVQPFIFNADKVTNEKRRGLS